MKVISRYGCGELETRPVDEADHERVIEIRQSLFG
jgi:hypothetical protein